MIVPSLSSARRVALRSLAATSAGTIDLLPTSTGDLVDFIHDARLEPRFVGLNVGMHAMARASDQGWLQAIPGFVPQPLAPAVLEFSRQAPGPGAASMLPAGCLVAIWDLALYPDSEGRGAVVAIGREGIVRGLDLAAWVDSNDLGHGGGDALRALGRCGDLAASQMVALERLRSGLAAATGLPPESLPSDGHGCVPPWVVVRRPAGLDPATFYAYVKREGTGARWLTLERPLHFEAVAALGVRGVRRAVAHLSEWVLLPTGPGDAEHDSAQRALAVVKSVHYLGARRSC